jgi:hypothetical protein
MNKIWLIASTIGYMVCSLVLSFLYQIFRHQRSMTFDTTIFYVETFLTAMFFVVVSYGLYLVFRKFPPTRFLAVILLGLGAAFELFSITPIFLMNFTITNFYPIACGVVLLFTALALKNPSSEEGLPG